MKQLYAPHFTAAVIIDPRTGKVAEAAPILAYTVGWDQVRLYSYARRKRWAVLDVE